MKYVEKSLEKDDIIDALIKGGNNEKKAKELVDKHYNDVMKTYRGQNLTAKKVVDIILSFEVSDAGVKDPLRDSVQTFTVEEEVKITQGESILVLEKGDVVRVLPKMQEAKMAPMVKANLERSARIEKSRGGSVEINYKLPTVSVTLGNGDNFFFQGDEASDLLEEIPENMSEEDYLLGTAIGW